MERASRPPFDWGDSDALKAAYLAHCNQFAGKVFLRVSLSAQRIVDVFAAWKEDLERNSNRNFKDGRGSEVIEPDHIKAGAYLTYWLRREGPIMDIITKEVAGLSAKSEGGMYSEAAMAECEAELIVQSDSGDLDPVWQEISQEELAKIILEPNGLTLKQILEGRSKLFAHGNELLAFTFGFQLAKTYHEIKLAETGTQRSISFPPFSFVDELCYMFKFKNISPHCIYMIYRSLLDCDCS